MPQGLIFIHLQPIMPCWQRGWRYQGLLHLHWLARSSFLWQAWKDPCGFSPWMKPLMRYQ